MIGHPPSGALPFGAKTVPVTNVSEFEIPDVDVYVILPATDVIAGKRLSIVGSPRASRKVPGPAPEKSPCNRTPLAACGVDADESLPHPAMSRAIGRSRQASVTLPLIPSFRPLPLRRCARPALRRAQHRGHAPGR